MEDESLPIIDMANLEMQEFMIKNYHRIKSYLEKLMKKEQFSEKQIALNQKKFEAMMRSYGLSKTQKNVSSTLVYAPVEPQALISKIGSLSGVAMSNEILKSFWGRIREKMDNYQRFEYPAEDTESQETNFLTQPAKKPRRNIQPRYIRRPDCAKMLTQALKHMDKPLPNLEVYNHPESELEDKGYVSSLTTDFHFTVAEFKKYQQTSLSERKLCLSSSARATEPETPSRTRALVPGRSALITGSSSRISTQPLAKSQELLAKTQQPYKAAYDMFNSRARVIGPMSTSRWDSLQHLVPQVTPGVTPPGQGVSSSKVLPGFHQVTTSQFALPTFANLQQSAEKDKDKEKAHRRGESTAVGSAVTPAGAHTHERLPSGAEFRIRSRNGSGERYKMPAEGGGPSFGAF